MRELLSDGGVQLEDVVLCIGIGQHLELVLHRKRVRVDADDEVIDVDRFRDVTRLRNRGSGRCSSILEKYNVRIVSSSKKFLFASNDNEDGGQSNDRNDDENNSNCRTN